MHVISVRNYCMGKVLKWWTLGCWSAVGMVFAAWTLPLYGRKSFFPGICVERGKRWLRCMGEMIKSHLGMSLIEWKGEKWTAHLLLVAYERKLCWGDWSWKQNNLRGKLIVLLLVKWFVFQTNISIMKQVTNILMLLAAIGSL